MREIKFRAWDKEYKRMISAKEFEEYFPLQELFLDRSLEFMQYTGIKDRNGKEIYEGDIITTDIARPYLIVEYCNGAFMFNCNDGGKDYRDIMFSVDSEPQEEYRYGEIIGNIYENPELLEGVK